MFKNTIGDKAAKEIAKYIVKLAKESGVEMPYMQKFIEEGPVPSVLIEAYQEMRNTVNNGKAVKSIRVAYEDTNKFHDYVMGFLPSASQLAMVEYYGRARVLQVKENN
jgi:hypothetical protein